MDTSARTPTNDIGDPPRDRPAEESSDPSSILGAVCLYHRLIDSIVSNASDGYFYRPDEWIERLYLRCVIDAESLLAKLAETHGNQLRWERPIESLSDFESLELYDECIRPAFLALGGRLQEAHIRSGERPPNPTVREVIAEIARQVNEWGIAKRRRDEALMQRSIESIRQEHPSWSDGQASHDQTPAPSAAGSGPVDLLQVFAEQIDQFRRISGRPQPSAEELVHLREIPESSVKAAFAEIIGEPEVPKDWGGEYSDLFTTTISIDGRRIPTAILFKGPSQFAPMTPRSLGKNGDQIVRLFDEPADLVIVQHCHVVKQAVRKQLRAFATQPGHPRRYCVIDGYDTLRILRTYRKCGLKDDQ